MARLTISDAARVTGVSRITLHRYIKAGKLSRSGDGTIDTAELLRAGFELHLETPHRDTSETHVLPRATPSETPPVTAPDPATLQQLITVLQRELDAAHAREEAAREREALLLQMLQQVQQQNQRLLDMPRTLPPSLPGQHAAAAPEAPRGEMRRRIVALLQDHPEGLSPAQVRRLLAVDRDLGSTMKAMARDGRLRRVATGRYMASETPKHEHP
jgi:hypothetical protein